MHENKKKRLVNAQNINTSKNRPTDLSTPYGSTTGSELPPLHEQYSSIGGALETTQNKCQRETQSLGACSFAINFAPLWHPNITVLAINWESLQQVKWDHRGLSKKPEARKHESPQNITKYIRRCFINVYPMLLNAHNPSQCKTFSVQHSPVPGNPKDGTSCQSDDLRYRQLIFQVWECTHPAKNTLTDWMRHSSKVSNLLQPDGQTSYLNINHQMHRRPQNCSTKLSAKDGWCIYSLPQIPRSKFSGSRPTKATPLHLGPLWEEAESVFKDGCSQFMKMALNI